MTAIELRVVGIPQPQGNKTAFLNKRTNKIVMTEGRRPDARRNFHDWREAVRLAATDWLDANHHPPPIAGPIMLTIAFLLPRPKSAPKRIIHHVTRPDLDKLGRAVLDALTISGLIEDDSRVITLMLSKGFAGSESPGARIHLSPVIVTVADV